MGKCYYLMLKTSDNSNLKLEHLRKNKVSEKYKFEMVYGKLLSSSHKLNLQRNIYKWRLHYISFSFKIIY